MANTCYNEFYASTNCEENLNYIQEFLKNRLKADIHYVEDEMLEACFDSRWTFPESIMTDMCNGLPNKKDDDLYIRCLSVEYGCLYHDLLVYDMTINNFKSV